MKIAPTWRNLVFAAATVSALGFGAAQAFASPAAPAAGSTACSTWSCPECGSFGGQWVPSKGRCYCCG